MYMEMKVVELPEKLGAIASMLLAAIAILLVLAANVMVSAQAI